MSYALLVSAVGGNFQAAANKIANNDVVPKAMRFRQLPGNLLPMERILGEQDTDFEKAGRRTGEARGYFPGRTMSSNDTHTFIGEAAGKEGTRHYSTKTIQRFSNTWEETLPGN
jgi:hypothetical protein